MTETFKNQLVQESSALGMTLTDRQQEQLFTYYEMLAETNKVMNLTAITEESDVVTKHFIDSLAIVKAVAEADVSRETFNEAVKKAFEGKNLIDVGTGAGFPGLVLKIAFPELNVVLTDSLMKRLNFLNAVIEKLGLKGVKTIHGRAEDLGHDKSLRQKFDYSVSRAVANLSTLSEYDLPFARVNGLFIAYKSDAITDELKLAEKAIAVLGGAVSAKIEYMLPGSEIGRSLIVVRKVRETSNKYPRKAGTPAKEPLQ